MQVSNRYQIYGKVIWLLQLSALCLLFPVPEAQAKKTEIRHINQKDGLAQNSVKSMVMDKNGFLWIATEAGLSRFDGSNFVNYNTGNSILATNRIEGVTRKRNGRISIVTSKSNRGFYTIDDAGQLHSDSTLSQKKSVFINGYAPVVIDKPLLLTDEQGNKIALPKAEDLQHEYFHYVPLPKQKFYYWNEDTLRWIDGTKAIFKNIGIVPGLQHPVLLGNDCLIFFDKRSGCTIWKGQEKQEQQPGTPSFRSLLNELQNDTTSRINWFRNNSGKDVLLRKGKAVWLLQIRNGIIDATKITEGLDAPQEISALLYDSASQALFIGTMTDGLYILREQKFGTITSELYTSRERKSEARNFSRYFSRYLFSPDNIYSQVQINSHTVVNWYYSYDPFQMTAKPLPLPLISNHWGTGFYRDRNGFVWYSRLGQIYIADSNFVTLDSIPFEESSGIKKDVVLTFWEDGSGGLGISNSTYLGYIKNRRVTDIPLPESLFNEADITSVFLFDLNTLWVTTSKGIFPYDKKNGKFGKNLLPGHPVRYVYKANDNSIWVCTYGRGMYRYLQGRFVPMPLDAGKFLLFPHSIYEDSLGFFWIPTNNGIFQCLKKELDDFTYRPQVKSVYYYHHTNTGKYTDEFNGGCSPAFVKIKNLLLLPSLRGVVVFDPLKVKPLLPNKVIFIESMQVDNHKITAPALTVAPDFQRLEVFVSTPYYGDQENNVLEYQLSGLEQEWYSVKNNRIVVNRLPHGEYKIILRKRTGFGRDNFTYKIIDCHVLPYWYQTFWFWLLLFVVSCGSIYFFVRRRYRRLLRAGRRLEELVAVRTSELKSTVSELEVSEQELSRITRLQEQALSIILHDIRSPLRYLSVSSQYFNQQVDKLPMEEIRAHAVSLMRTTENIDNLAEQLVQWLTTSVYGPTLEQDDIDVPLLLNDLAVLYRDIAAVNRNTISVSVSGVKYIKADKNKLYLILRNLVDNATKYCHEGNILVSGMLNPEQTQVILSVSDTGNGISKDILEELNKDAIAPPDFNKDRLGLHMVFYFVKLMQGTVQVTSEPGKGTTITITLSL